MGPLNCTANSLHILLRLLASKGIKTQQLPPMDLPADALFNSRSRIAVSQLLHLLDWAQEQLPQQNLALDYGLALALHQPPLFSTLAQGCTLLQQDNLLSQLFSLHREDDGETCHIELRWRANPALDAQLPDNVLDVVLAWLHARCLPFIAASHNDIQLYLPHTCEQPQRYAAYVPLTIRSNAPFLAIRLPQRLLHAEADPHNLPTLQHQMPPRASLMATSKAANLLRHDLPEPPSLEVLSRALELSERTCKRRLQDSGTHYQKLLSELRLIQARDWLQRRVYNVTQLSAELGYSSVANFSKAFKKWCGYSPSQAHQVKADAEHSVAEAQNKQLSEVDA
ncbi:helix-turn-helix transcriptional regulator [Thalassolituus pacificus]|uniref:AraC family transcriptional regulator n=1 Tax=Thalassolituus pacificus TaxID=2975440 RepID=A0A9X2WGQ5_9GAMM|nr:AraC family transcriptional regulator [Thalassolituus pacificus]MCT7359442.1 AraC family transcriptional regulator [Thalassolituus pacificus]